MPSNGRITAPQVALRSSSSIDTPSGARRKATRTPGRTVVGSRVNSTPLALSSATMASMPLTRRPKWSRPRYGVVGGGLTPSPGVTSAMKMLAPPSLRSMRGLPCCMVRMTSAPSIRSYHRAVPSGSVVRKWMWSQVYAAIGVLHAGVSGRPFMQKRRRIASGFPRPPEDASERRPAEARVAGANIDRGIDAGAGLELVHVVARGRAHDVDVRAHHLARGLGVSLQDGIDDGAVLRVGFGQTVLQRELGAPERRNPLANSDRRRQQKVVVCSAIDDVVELEIERPVGLLVVAADRLERAPVNELEPDALGRRHPLRREPRARRLQLAHDLEHLRQRRIRGK